MESPESGSRAGYQLSVSVIEHTEFAGHLKLAVKAAALMTRSAMTGYIVAVSAEKHSNDSMILRTRQTIRYTAHCVSPGLHG